MAFLALSVLSIPIDRHVQTLQIQIRFLLKEQSDKGILIVYNLLCNAEACYHCKTSLFSFEPCHKKTCLQGDG